MSINLLINYYNRLSIAITIEQTYERNFRTVLSTKTFQFLMALGNESEMVINMIIMLHKENEKYLIII